MCQTWTNWQCYPLGVRFCLNPGVVQIFSSLFEQFNAECLEEYILGLPNAIRFERFFRKQALTTPAEKLSFFFQEIIFVSFPALQK